jgi:hypothetical protein
MVSDFAEFDDGSVAVAEISIFLDCGVIGILSAQEFIGTPISARMLEGGDPEVEAESILGRFVKSRWSEGTISTKFGNNPPRLTTAYGVGRYVIQRDVRLVTSSVVFSNAEQNPYRKSVCSEHIGLKKFSKQG